MGRPKHELKKIHKKKVKKAKKKANLFLKGEILSNQLTQRAKHFLKKGKNKRSEPISAYS